MVALPTFSTKAIISCSPTRYQNGIKVEEVTSAIIEKCFLLFLFIAFRVFLWKVKLDPWLKDSSSLFSIRKMKLYKDSNSADYVIQSYIYEET